MFEKFHLSLFALSRIVDFDDYLYSQSRIVNPNDLSSDEDLNEDEDSNDENNWRNEYPDEEEDCDSVGENDMRRAVQNMNMGKS